jgi:multiple sugar transport system permease protein
MAPAVILFALVVAWPTLDTFRVSTYQSSPFGPDEFAGLDNYTRLLHDPLFWKSLRITGVWTLVVVPTVAILGLLAALALHRRWLRGVGFWRTVYFAPVMTSMVAASFTWKWMFDPGSGVINTVLRWLGVTHPPDWLASPDWALPAVMIVGVWQQIGYAMILFLAGLQTIPAHFYEAAAIDGAGRWRTFRSITLPLLNPTVVFVSVILVINAFRVFTIPYVMSSGSLSGMTPGGPLNSTRVFVLHIYDVAWHQYDMGYGAANAVVLLALTLVVSVVQMKVVTRPFEY